jgi:hypothetical protein
MAFVVEEDELTDPANVVLLSAVAVVAFVDFLPDLVQKKRFIGHVA